MTRLWLALVPCALVAACSRGDAPHVAVGAAAVMRHAMPELVARHEAMTGAKLDVVYGASDKLAAQAQSGATLDVLVLAEPGAFAGVNAGAPRGIATTTLVLVGPAGAPYRFGNLRDEGVIAIGEPETVPAGRYARTYLRALGSWDAVEPRLVFGGDVAGVLALARRGTAHVAIVYATDTTDAAPLVVLDRASDGPVVQVAAAATTRSRNRGAADRFIEFLASAEAKAILTRHGFAEVVR